MTKPKESIRRLEREGCMVPSFGDNTAHSTHRGGGRGQDDVTPSGNQIQSDSVFLNIMHNNLHCSKVVQNPAWQTLVPFLNAPEEEWRLVWQMFSIQLCVHCGWFGAQDLLKAIINLMYRCSVQCFCCECGYTDWVGDWWSLKQCRWCRVRKRWGKSEDVLFTQGDAKERVSW